MIRPQIIKSYFKSTERKDLSKLPSNIQNIITVGDYFQTLTEL